MRNKVITMQNVLKEFAAIYGRRPDKKVIEVVYKFFERLTNTPNERIKQIVMGEQV